MSNPMYHNILACYPFILERLKSVVGVKQIKEAQDLDVFFRKKVAPVDGTVYVIFDGCSPSNETAGKNKRKDGKILHEYLSEVVGELNAQKIEEIRLSLSTVRQLYVPKCKDAILELRNRSIRRSYDELLREGMGAIWAVRNLARVYDLTDRHVLRIVNEPDKTLDDSAKQTSLF